MRHIERALELTFGYTLSGDHLNPDAIGIFPCPLATNIVMPLDLVWVRFADDRALTNLGRLIDRTWAIAISP
jgi:hypothetical protein